MAFDADDHYMLVEKLDALTAAVGRVADAITPSATPDHTAIDAEAVLFIEIYRALFPQSVSPARVQVSAVLAEMAARSSR